MTYRIPGLTAAQNDVVVEQIAGRYTYDCVGEIQTLDGEGTADLAGLVVDGQVDLKARTPIGRAATVTLSDPDFDLALPRNETYLSRMLALFIRFYVQSLDQAVLVPIFRGPFYSAKRQGHLIVASAHGKAKLAMRAVDAVKTIPKNTLVTDIVYELLVGWAGESPAHLRLPHLGDRHPTAIESNLITRPWPIAKSVVRALGYELAYDGAGDCFMRQFPTDPILELTDGDDGTILSPLTRDESDEDFWNTVHVHGHNAGKKPSSPGDVSTTGISVYARADAEDRSPLSALTLERGGVPGVVPKTIVNRGIKTETRAQQVADAWLARGLNNALTYQLVARPFWMWDEWDCASVNEAGTSTNINPPDVSLPLTPSFGNYMTLGWNGHISHAGARARIS